MKMMKFYHGTSQETWNKIQKEGCLFGVRNAPSRCTYLAMDKEEAVQYGDVVLEVDYDPTVNPEMNNYYDGCWQMRVYEPISLKDIRVV